MGYEKPIRTAIYFVTIETDIGIRDRFNINWFMTSRSRKTVNSF